MAPPTNAQLQEQIAALTSQLQNSDHNRQRSKDIDNAVKLLTATTTKITDPTEDMSMAVHTYETTNAHAVKKLKQHEANEELIDCLVAQLKGDAFKKYDLSAIDIVGKSYDNFKQELVTHFTGEVQLQTYLKKLFSSWTPEQTNVERFNTAFKSHFKACFNQPEGELAMVYLKLYQHAFLEFGSEFYLELSSKTSISEAEKFVINQIGTLKNTGKINDLKRAFNFKKKVQREVDQKVSEHIKSGDMETKNVQINSITKFSQFEKERYSPYPSRGNSRGNGRGRGRGRGRRRFGRGGYNGQPPTEDSTKPAGQENQDQNYWNGYSRGRPGQDNGYKGYQNKNYVPQQNGYNNQKHVSVDSVQNTDNENENKKSQDYSFFDSNNIYTHLNMIEPTQVPVYIPINNNNDTPSALTLTTKNKKKTSFKKQEKLNKPVSESGFRPIFDGVIDDTKSNTSDLCRSPDCHSAKNNKNNDLILPYGGRRIDKSEYHSDGPIGKLMHIAKLGSDEKASDNNISTLNTENTNNKNAELSFVHTLSTRQYTVRSKAENQLHLQLDFINNNNDSIKTDGVYDPGSGLSCCNYSLEPILQEYVKGDQIVNVNLLDFDSANTEKYIKYKNNILSLTIHNNSDNHIVLTEQIGHLNFISDPFSILTINPHSKGGADNYKEKVFKNKKQKTTQFNMGKWEKLQDFETQLLTDPILKNDYEKNKNNVQNYDFDKPNESINNFKNKLNINN
eukprot:Pgem_evm1s20278